MRALPAGMAAQISAAGQEPALQVTVQDLVNRYSQLASGGTTGRTAAILTSAGTLLIARVPQGTDPNSLLITRIGDPAAGSQWTAPPTTAATNAVARAGCALAQTGNTIRVFYQSNSTSNIVYRDSTNDGVTWSAEQTTLPSHPTSIGNFCYGLAADDVNTVLAAYASYDPNGSAVIWKSAFTTSWSSWASTGPTSPGWGLVRGMQMINVSGVHILTAGVQLKAGLGGISACTTTTTDMATFTGWAAAQQLDNPDLGLSLAYPSVHFSGGTYYLSVTMTDSGTISGTAHTRTTVFTSADLSTWMPLVSLGGAFQYGAHAMVVRGVLYVFDGASAYSAPAGPGPTDVSDDVLSLSIEERINQPARATLVLSNLDGRYNSHPSIRTDTTIKVWQGYGTNLVQTHTLLVDSYTYEVAADRNQLIIQARDVAKLLDYPSTRLLSYASKTIGQLITTICRLAGLGLAALPSTSQFSQTVPCFVVAPGETWLVAMQRLSVIYGFDFFADATPQLRVCEPNAADSSTWTYGTEIMAVSVSYNADQANVIRVAGTSAGGTVFAEAIDGANLVSVGKERYRQVVDRMLDTAARAQIKANLVLRDEQAQAFMAQLVVAPNPAHERDDVITFSEAAFGSSNQKARIVGMGLTIHPDSGTWMQKLECTGV